MVMIYLLIHILLVSFSFEIEIESNANDVYELNYFFDELKKPKITKADSIKLINTLCQILERFVYLDFLKSYKNQYNRIYLIDDLQRINNTEYESLYDFYRDLRIIIDKCQDSHLNLFLYRPISGTFTFDNCYFIFPMFFKIENKKVYSYPILEFKKYFSGELIEKIKGLKSYYIRKINDMEPLDYIQQFNGEFYKQKSSQCQFIFNQISIHKIKFNNFPFKIQHLTDIKIEYSNGEIIIQNYKVLEEKNLKNQNSFQYITDNAKFFNELNDKRFNDIKWDKEIDNGNIKCRIDPNRGVNVIVQKTFAPSNTNEAKEFFDYCFSSFDNNHYPLVIIENLNGGGNKDLADYLVNYINLNSLSSVPTSYRYNEIVKDFVSDFSNFDIKDIETCKIKKSSSLFESKADKDNLGSGIYFEDIIHMRTKNFDFSTIDRNKFNELRKNIKYLRKPTEIIIFTDGFSYSATSHFIKQTQLKGGAIIVGYGGNPNLDIFDASQNPSTVISTRNSKNDNLSQDIENLGFTLRYPITEEYDHNDIMLRYIPLPDKETPLGYKTLNIDERIDIYNKYDDSQYDNFITNALQIFQKYKNRCNPNNIRLLKIDNNCEFGDHMHGGYQCNSNGQWSNNCFPSFCDIGYTFNNKDNKCIKDICMENTVKKNVFGILAIIFFVLFIMLLIIILCGFKNFISVIILIIFLFLFIIFLILYLTT